MAAPNQTIAAPLARSPAQAQASAQTPNMAIRDLKEQRAWPFESSYLVMEDLEDYLDGLPELRYTLSECGDRIILFANRDLTEAEARQVEAFSGKVYND